MVHWLGFQLLLLPLIFCCCGASTAVPERARPSAKPSPLLQQLQFGTNTRVGGCPLSLYLIPSNNGINVTSNREAFLAPSLCLTEDFTSFLSAACPQFDAVMNVTYFSVRVTIADPRLLAGARETLSPLLQGRQLKFLQSVVGMRYSAAGGSGIRELVWQPDEEFANVRLICRDEFCSDLQNWDSLDETEVDLEVQLSLGSHPISLKHRISVANRSRSLDPILTSPVVLPAPKCNQLQLWRTLTPDESCRVTVLQRTDRKGHFVMEPMLCYHGNFTEQGGVVRLTLAVRSSRVRDSVTRALSHLSPLSVTFMSMVGAELRVSESLLLRTGWSFETLRLSVDGDSAELRVRCGSADSCRMLVQTLRYSSLQLWQHLAFSLDSQPLESMCTWRSYRAVAAFKPDFCGAGDASHRHLSAYHPTDGHLCIRPPFVKQLPSLSTSACAYFCSTSRKCQAFSTASGQCELYLFDRCSKNVKDCSCARRGRVFVKKRRGLQPGKLCPDGYLHDRCGVKYKVHYGTGNWRASRQKCESDDGVGLVIMADIMDAAEQTHIQSLLGGLRLETRFLWLGGHQPPGSTEPAGGWRWAACDIPVAPSLWRAPEPNNWRDLDENVTGYWRDSAQINDVPDSSGLVVDVLCECVSPF